MAWRIEYLRAARKDIEKLDRQAAKRIRQFLEERLAQLDDPRVIGEALKGKFGTFWRYRVGESSPASRTMHCLSSSSASSTEKRCIVEQAAQVLEATDACA